MEIYKKLAKVKSEIGKISKDSTNPFFKSKYFDVNALLEHVEPILISNDLLLLQPIKDGKVVTQIINPEDGEMVSSEVALPQITDPQKLGSAITYYRRYSLQSLLGLQAEDDDGNKASATAPRKTTKISAEKRLTQCKDLNELKAVFSGLTQTEKKAWVVLKDSLKEKLTPKSA